MDNSLWVYLIKSQKRLIISNIKICNADYHELLNSNGNNVLTICKSYCIGLIQGSKLNMEIINNVQEFF